jgi:hypothetical protein
VVTGLGFAAAPQWRQLRNWAELARCQKVRIHWPKRDALMSGAPRKEFAKIEEYVNPLEGYKASEPQVRPELFEWREGVPRTGRKVELDGGVVLDLPKALGDFQGLL